MGDFNIHFFNVSSNNCINKFVNILYDNSFRPLIDKPTRITTTSATLIDNILTNHGAHIFYSVWDFLQWYYRSSAHISNN